MGNVFSIKIGYDDAWNAWIRFRRAKRPSREICEFESRLLVNVFELADDLATGAFTHGAYRMMQISDKKRRDISIASVRDRIVHRLLYDYLVEQFDRGFIFDAWSCRVGKGLHACLLRTKNLLAHYHRSHVWRFDITKFFDHVRHDVLLELLRRRITDDRALRLLEIVIASWPVDKKVERERERVHRCVGIPIGNVTSQIFANIYFNEFDRFVMHELRPQGYVRYGDDGIIIAKDRHALEVMRMRARQFLNDRLGLVVSVRHDIIVPVRRGIYFLGMELWPQRAQPRGIAIKLMRQRLSLRNASSYYGLSRQYGAEWSREFAWLIAELL